MRILLTNDDGIEAQGIRVLWKELASVTDVTVSVVAPDAEQSATSQAITVRQPIRVDPYSIEQFPRFSAWRVNGTPTDCVKVALEALLEEKPDIVVSGINHGPNLGTDVLYSGTVSAAIEGALHGIPSVAVSLNCFKDFNFSPAAQFMRTLIFMIMKQGLPPNTLLNVNVPAFAGKEIAGVAITKLGVRQYKNTFERREDPHGRIYYWMGGKLADSKNDDDSDVAAVGNNLISVTPVHFDLTNYNIMHLLQSWNLSTGN
ncbi:MAG: 5'/3'-nucleotidase SurE [Veillonellales bacterium]